ncbi:hypothetical protein C7H79_16630 [Nitrosomonas supralitoralis]|uniref:Transposase n=1 Tax=Nitrosomonas supralitoralis TaxID=2116706 RepID=A0A2P7NQY8_9PROT|nr:hypothetical protein C7H79_16630 [Nitrosomonas supralitoralis]
MADLCREHGASSASFYKWRSKYGVMDATLLFEMNEFGTIENGATYGNTMVVDLQ